MGKMYSSARTQAGMFSGSSFTNYSVFYKRAEKWREEVRKLTVSKDGLTVEAEWFNGDWRQMTYSPHPNEDTSYKIQPIRRIKQPAQE